MSLSLCGEMCLEMNHQVPLNIGTVKKKKKKQTFVLYDQQHEQGRLWYKKRTRVSKENTTRWQSLKLQQQQ